MTSVTMPMQERDVKRLQGVISAYRDVAATVPVAPECTMHAAWQAIEHLGIEPPMEALKAALKRAGSANWERPNVTLASHFVWQAA